ncbi:MAG: hypothetical protein L6V92_09210 [Phocaeicola vulgatus]|nr:MAG: hypothetical protein L6V92_09210 [Phocaeicola vulgatus]
MQAEDANLLFHHYQVENGLSNNMVTACVQDKDGYIWIGTRDGLNRFDGYNFKGFRQDSDSHSLGSNWISCLACDSTGNLWVGTLSGLYEYIPENESFKHIPFTTNKSITDFKFDKQNNLWLLLDGNLIKYNKATSEFKTFTHHGGQAYTSFCITDNNQIWIGDMQGDISLFDTEQESVKVFNLFDKHLAFPLKKYAMSIHLPIPINFMSHTNTMILKYWTPKREFMKIWTFKKSANSPSSSVAFWKKARTNYG